MSDEPELPDIRVVSVIFDEEGTLRIETSDYVSKYEALGMLRAGYRMQEDLLAEEEWVEEEEED